MRLRWKLPVEHLSATSLAMFVTCPEQFRRRYLLKQRDKLFGDRFIGLVDHKMHERNFEQKIRTGHDLPLDQMKAEYATVWSDTIDLEGEPEWKDIDPSTMYDRGLAAVSIYHEQVSPTVNPVAVEQRVEFNIRGVPVPIIGYLDVLEKGRVIDRKTTKTKLSKPKSKWRLQGRIYSYATWLPFEVHLITKQATPQVVTAADAPKLLMQPPNPKTTESFIVAVTRNINETYERYGRDTPWPQHGMLHDWACQYCTFGPEYEASCPLWTDVVAPNISDAEGA